MKDYLQLWFDSLRARPKGTIPARLEITGEIDKHTGPAWVRAGVTMVLEPADTFELVDEVEDKGCFANTPYADHIVAGLLSVLMTAQMLPICNIKVTLKALKIDPIETSLASFELAGRDAGRKVLEAIRKR